MLRSIVSTIFLFILAVSFYSIFNYGTLCDQTLKYDIGNVDSRFGLSEAEFLKSIQKAEKIWEDQADRNYFQYQPDSAFLINLIFDDRQQKSNVNNELISEIDDLYAQYESAKNKVELLQLQHDQDTREYKNKLSLFEQSKSEYDTQVSYWNQRGGAPSAEYQKLNEQYEVLQKLYDELESDRQNLNSTGDKLNQAIQLSNSLAQKYNDRADVYTKLFHGEEHFNQGVYQKRSINIYQFNNLHELDLVLAHELGHALGIDHVKNPNAIMYYFMDDSRSLRLIEDDIEALNQACSGEGMVWYDKIHFNPESKILHYLTKAWHVIISIKL